jgi:HSP20 family protein
LSHYDERRIVKMMNWDLFGEMAELRREIEKTFGEFGIKREPFTRVAFLPGKAARRYPMINIYEDKDNIYVEALAPGLTTESLNLTVQGNTLTITGEKRRIEAKPVDFHRSERASGTFSRRIELPVNVDEGKVQASYQDGLLLVILPKAEEAKPKQINVEVS